MDELRKAVAEVVWRAWHENRDGFMLEDESLETADEIINLIQRNEKEPTEQTH